MSITEAEKMSTGEQIDAMEKLWSALSRNETSVNLDEVKAPRRMQI